MSLKRKIFLAGLHLTSPILLISEKVLAANFTTNTFGGKECGTFGQWIGEVWGWALTIIVPLSVLILSAAGVLYMISGGEPERIKTSKKMMWGVISGIAIIVLARVFLINVLGLSDDFWNISERCK